MGEAFLQSFLVTWLYSQNLFGQLMDYMKVAGNIMLVHIANAH